MRNGVAIGSNPTPDGTLAMGAAIKRKHFVELASGASDGDYPLSARRASRGPSTPRLGSAVAWIARRIQVGEPTPGGSTGPGDNTTERARTPWAPRMSTPSMSAVADGPEWNTV